MWGDKFAFVAAIYLLIVVFFAVFGPWLIGDLATSLNLRLRNAPPGSTEHGWAFILGADALGRSILARLIVASRNTMGIAAAAPGQVIEIFEAIPHHGAQGDLITLVGSNFGNDPDDLCVAVENGSELLFLKAVAANDTGTVRSLAHSMKGASKQIGATRAGTLLGRIEEQEDFTEIQTLIDQLDEEVPRVESAVRALLRRSLRAS